MGFAILPQVEYDAHETLGTVPADRDYVGFKGRLRKVLQALRGDRVAIRPCTVDGHYGVLFGAYQIANIDLTSKECVGDVPGLNTCHGHPRLVFSKPTSRMTKSDHDRNRCLGSRQSHARGIPAGAR